MPEDGQQFRKSTNEDGLPQAKQFAEDWYLTLRGKARAGILKKREPTFSDAASVFTEEYEIITQGQRSEKWTEGHQIRLRKHHEAKNLQHRDITIVKDQATGQRRDDPEILRVAYQGYAGHRRDQCLAATQAS
jgi:hypothetical protein